MGARELMERELDRASPVSEQLKARPLRLDEVAQLPITKADLASEAKEFAAACKHAELNGNEELKELRSLPRYTDIPREKRRAHPEDYTPR